jgi:hypothetical protein
MNGADIEPRLAPTIAIARQQFILSASLSGNT